MAVDVEELPTGEGTDLPIRKNDGQGDNVMNEYLMMLPSSL